MFRYHSTGKGRFIAYTLNYVFTLIYHIIFSSIYFFEVTRLCEFQTEITFLENYKTGNVRIK